MAYVLAGGPAVASASAAGEPRAITFYNFENLEGVRMATEWKFWRWNAEVGIYDKPVGSGRVYNLEFIAPKAGAFDRPADAREDPASGAR
jgi:hypothetical protein